MEQPTDSPTLSGRSAAVAGVALVVLLFAVAAGLIFQGGSYGPSTWLPLVAAVAALAIVVAAAGPAVRSGGVQKVLLLVFVLQVAWTAASVLWADSQNDAWEEANRTLLYASTVILMFVAVRWAGGTGLKALAVSVTTLACAVALWVILALALFSDPSTMFLHGRLNYPITYFNGLAALLMVGFWLALGMANGARCARRSDEMPDLSDGEASDPAPLRSRVAYRRWQTNKRVSDRFRRWTQPLALAVAVVLLETALLPQSRGALWTFFLVIPFFVILSPNRFRSLIDLIIVAAPVVIFWNRLNAPYLAITGQAPLDPAIQDYLLTVGYSVAGVVGAWLITWLIERWVGPLRRKATVWISVAIAAVAILGAAGGVVVADMHTGGLDTYLQDNWHEMTADDVGADQGATRFSGVGLNGRVRTWRVAVEAFRSEPLLGIGAQNFEYYWYEHRTVEFAVRQPHSQLIQLLSELGLPGVVLWLAFLIGTLIWAATVRFRASTWGGRVVVAALMTAVISWFIHSSADWLWQLAGVSLPVMMLLGGLIGADRRSPVVVSQADSAPEVAVPTEDPEHAGSTDAVEAESAADLPAATESQPATTGRRVRRSRGPHRSAALRTLAAAVALVALASAALPYLSLRYSSMAAGATDLQQAESRANIAAALDPTSMEPSLALATAHRAAASAALTLDERLRQLRLAADAWVQAAQREPNNWICHYGAAEALIEAGNIALAIDRATAQELEAEARTNLTKAHELNPLSSEIAELEVSLRALGTTGTD